MAVSAKEIFGAASQITGELYEDETALRVLGKGIGRDRDAVFAAMVLTKFYAGLDDMGGNTSEGGS
jgi:hypothetical protein